MEEDLEATTSTPTPICSSQIYTSNAAKQRQQAEDQPAIELI
jgi:hypothetical protein